jgi:hypothetical protein
MLGGELARGALQLIPNTLDKPTRAASDSVTSRARRWKGLRSSAVSDCRIAVGVGRVLRSRVLGLAETVARHVVSSGSGAAVIPGAGSRSEASSSAGPSPFGEGTSTSARRRSGCGFSIGCLLTSRPAVPRRRDKLACLACSARGFVRELLHHPSLPGGGDVAVAAALARVPERVCALPGSVVRWEHVCPCRGHALIARFLPSTVVQLAHQPDKARVR